MCSDVFDLEATERFEQLVNRSYGYRLFLDDLPSATVIKGQTHYEWAIPLGFTTPPMNANEDGRVPYQPVGIYNHLDIKIKVHPTLKSSLVGTKEKETFKVPVGYSDSLEIELPSQELRIVGFEVTPMSVEGAYACSDGADLSKAGHALLFPESEINFSYSVTIVHSNDEWPSRLDHYLNFGNKRIFWEELLTSLSVLIVFTMIFSCVLCSALRIDFEFLG